jgi:uncharacterized LabA/DUF88 family protein
LWEAGFVVKTKVGTIAGDSYKCNVDVKMVMDIMKAVYEINNMCQYLFSKNLRLTFPVVNDGLPARIRALRSKDQGWQTVAE